MFGMTQHIGFMAEGGADPAYYLRIAEHRGTRRARYSGATIAVPTAPFPNQ